MYSQTIENLIKLFSKFPTVGPRTAARFVFYLIKKPKEEIDELLKSIEELKNKMKICSLCFKSFEPDSSTLRSVSNRADRTDLKQAPDLLCPICADTRRDKTLLCIVEKEVDLEAVENTHKFKGLYFILGGTMAGLKKEQEKKQIEKRLDKFVERIKKDSIKEVILALNPTTEGQSTALWLKRKLKDSKIKTTQLGRGLPVGGELEYADDETLSSALENRG